ncbi:MAG: aminomethyl-transferring glycine dehydrogenase subunit GcvPA [Deltaproteobacteria bacterium]|nr:aminomethyl-transferring glycine dehydrogenase subunit GcvPA [Deltaproteobacteria bacterium]
MRYIPHTPEETQQMLKSVGLRSVAELFSSIPESLHMEKPLNLPEPLDEASLFRHLEALAGKNRIAAPHRSFLGGGVYRHFIPSAVKNLIQRSEFVTPYTPYQPEIAQGTLQVIFEFQTMAAEMFGMEVANASLYDGSTALGEAILMALRLQPKRKIVLIPRCLHPEYRQTVQSLLKNFDVSLVEIPLSPTGGVDPGAVGDYLKEEIAACVFPYPNFFGIVENNRELIQRIKDQGGLIIFCVTEPLSLGLFESPGALGADIVCGEGQSLGLAPSFGGPFVGLFATKEKYVRQMPGRLCGMTTDSKGRRGFVLTLATREQHIRRERATSNICTNQALCATQMTVYLSLLGKQGFQKLAQLNWQRAEYAKETLTQIKGINLAYPKVVTFNEFVLKLPTAADLVLKELKQKEIEGGIALGRWYPELGNALLVNVTELNETEDIENFAAALKETVHGLP